MRSVVVVLPASMCAMMPMFLVRSSGYCESTGLPFRQVSGQLLKRRGGPGMSPPPGISSLPAVMCERLVGLRHLVGVFSLLHRRPAVVRRVEQLGGQLGRHALFRSATRGAYDPALAERGTTVGAHFDGNLIGRAANPLHLYPNTRLAIFDLTFQQLDRFLPRALFHHVHAVIHDPFGDALLASVHHHVDEFRDQPAPMLGVRENFASGGSCAAHVRPSSPLAASRRTSSGSAFVPRRPPYPATLG